MNFYSYAAAVIPFLTAAQKQKRFDLATKWSRWPFRCFKKIIFSDESRFNVHNSDGRVRVWCQPETRNNEGNCVASIKGDGGEIMVWGCIGYKGVGALTVVDGTIDSIKYTRVISTCLHETAAKLGLNDDFIFQQDNAPCHKSQYSMEFFKDNRRHF